MLKNISHFTRCITSFNNFMDLDRCIDIFTEETMKTVKITSRSNIILHRGTEINLFLSFYYNNCFTLSLKVFLNTMNINECY